MKKIQKPTEGEYAPYAITYIDLVSAGRLLVISHLQENLISTPEFIRSFPPEKLATPWKSGEWTIQENPGSYH